MSLLETFAKKTSTSLEKIAATVSVTFALYYIFHIILDQISNQNIIQEFSLSILFICSLVRAAGIQGRGMNVLAEAVQGRRGVKLKEGFARCST